VLPPGWGTTGSATRKRCRGSGSGLRFAWGWLRCERILADQGQGSTCPVGGQRITLTTSPLWRITMEVKEGWNPLALRTAPAREVQWVMQDAASGVEAATTVKSRVLVVAMGWGCELREF